MQLTQSLFLDEYDDLADLTDNERSTARNWHEDFRGRNFRWTFMHRSFCFSFTEKYDIVGRLLKAGEKPSVYPSEESAVGGNTNNDTKKTE